MKKRGFYQKIAAIFLFQILLQINFAQTVNKEILEEKLALAARFCNAEAVKNLLAKKVSPDSRDRFNQPAILLAFRCDFVKGDEKSEKIKEIVKILIEAGADVNVRNEFGVTPYLAAEIFDFINQSSPDSPNTIFAKNKLTDYLVSKGANPKAKDIYGRNGFMHLQNADTGETRGEQVWRHLIEGSGTLTIDSDLQFALTKEKVLEANQYRFGKFNAGLAMAAVYYDAFNLAKVIGATIPNIPQETDEEGENMYFYAARVDNPFRFRYLLGRTIFPQGNTLSDAEASEKFTQINRENLKKPNKNGLTPLELSYQTDAILFQNFAYQLLENPNEIDKEGLTPLFRVLQNKNFPLIFALLSHEKINADLPARSGVAPLIYAAEQNSVELVSLLLYGIRNPTANSGNETFKVASANINLPAKDGKTALMIAAEKGNSDLVKTLLRNGADIFLKDKKGETALSLARKNNRSAIVHRLSALMKTDAQRVSETKKTDAVLTNQTPLMFAAQNGDLANLQRLLKSGAKIDEVDADGKTALFYAILNDEIYAARILIDAKANVNHVSDGKITPLMTAAKFKRDQIIPLLLKAGAKINETDNSGKTALMSAIEADIETVNEILKGKPDVNLTDKTGNTAIVQIVKKGAFNAKDIVSALLKKGANANDSDKDNNNTIKLAVETRQDNLFVLLLKSGANPFQKGIFGFDTFTVLNTAYIQNIDEYNRLYKLIYENSLPKYIPKFKK